MSASVTYSSLSDSNILVLKIAAQGEQVAHSCLLVRDDEDKRSLTKALCVTNVFMNSPNDATVF